MPSDNLTREEARIRKSLVSNVKYNVYLDVTSSILEGSEHETFNSITTIEFDYSASTEFEDGLFFDLKARSINSIALNDKQLDINIFNDHRIEIRSGLQSGRNVLVVDALCEYTNTGEGLHRYFAEDENEVYLYTQFEVADSRRVYTVFEQPDIKATYDFTVKAPSHWIVTSTELETNIEEDGNNKTWTFGTTPTMSSYLTSLCAGPFEVWSDSHNNADGRVIPMRVLARKSLAKYMDYDVVFDITKRGFDYYAKLFDVPYMYNKYDQIFMPQFNAGAMENIGNVTYREDYVFNVKATEAMKERRVITILHELAHMWFGDYVTMKWWGDLWLNESFAEFVSVMATAEAIGRKNIWVQFNIHEKLWGIEQDEKPTTHPIAADIKDLNDVLVNFDGITYAKGAASLQVLMNYCGRDNFFAGISAYLKKYAYKNAELNDLLNCLEASTGRDLHTWTHQWIQTAGLNTFYADFSLADNRFNKFNIMQTANDANPTLRPHTLKVGFYNFTEDNDDSTLLDNNITATGALNLRGAKLKLSEQFTVNISDSIVTEVPEIVGKLRPDVILLNDEGRAFGKFRLDQASEDVILRYPHKFSDSLARAIALQSVWLNVRDGLTDPAKLIDSLFKLLPSETESITMQTFLRKLAIMAHQMIKPTERLQITKGIATHLWNLVKDAKPGSDAQYQFLMAFTDYASSEDHVEILKQLLSGEVQISGIELDNKILWQIRGALARLGQLDKAKILLARNEDKTEHGRLGVQFALGSINTIDAKRAVINEILSPWTKLSNAEIIAAAEGFNNVLDTELIHWFAAEYFERATQIWHERSFDIADSILRLIYPARIASLELAQMCERWLDEHDNEPDALKRIIIENLDMTRIALRAQKKNL